MNYSFDKNEQGWLQLTVANPTPSDKGLTPTEAENILRQLQEERFGSDILLDYQLKINISLKKSRKLNDSVIDVIKKKELSLCHKRGKHNYRYYALVLYALQKLGYVGADGEMITQSGFSEAFGLRRASLCTHYGKLEHVEQDNTYLEIEKTLFNDVI